MIIGVNGKIGSGKDTIGKIIQCLMNHPKITNKDLIWMMENNIVAEDSKCKIKKFAGKLKLIGSILSGVSVEIFEDQEFKKQYMSEEWNSFVSMDFPEMTGEEIKNSDSILVKTTHKRMTYREFLQRLGTEAMRDGLHTNVWVNALFADYKPIGEWFDEIKGNYKEYPSWCITDMRFPNEMDAVKERNGIAIRVVRYNVGDKVYWTDPEGVSSGVYEISEVYEGFCSIYNVNSEAEVFYHEIKHHSEDLHASETGLDDAEFDYEIVNSGTIEDLVEKVREILIKENII
jgi:hypothetical protein